MLKTNVDQLLEIAVVGEPSHPRLAGMYNITPRGEAIMVPGTGGICFNVRVGDRALGWAADHVEPAVSLTTRRGREQRPEHAGLRGE